MYIGFDVDNNLEVNLKKIKMHVEQEKTFVQSINESFEKSLTYYKTDNTKILNDLIFILNNNFKAISNIHENNIKVLENNSIQYLEINDR